MNPSTYKNENPASELTREHYRREDVQNTILRICALHGDSQDGFRWLQGGQRGWYKYVNGKCYGNKGNKTDYAQVTEKYRTLHHTTGFFRSEIFETDFTQMQKDTSVESELNKFSKKNCVGYTALFDIDTIDEVNGHGTNIEQPEVKAAVEKMVKFVCNELKQYAPNSVYTAFSGGGAYVLLHHEVFQDYIDYFSGKENQVENIILLSDALNLYITQLVKRFQEAEPEAGKYVKIDAINQPKRAVKTLLSVHKKKPYAVIPLDPASPEINFEAAKLPLSDSVIKSCEDWYKGGDRENGFFEMLHPLMVECQKEHRIKYKLIGNNEPCTLPEVRDIPEIKKFPPCMRNIVEKPVGGAGATRALSVLAAFLGHIGWSREDAFNLWSTVAKRWNAETSNIFNSWFGKMKCASCRTLMIPGSQFPHVNLVEFGVCKPDVRCLNRNLSNPVYVASEELYLKSFSEVRVL